MNIVVIVLSVLVGILISFVLGVMLHKKQISKIFDEAQEESRKLREEARKEADALKRDAIRDSKEEVRKKRANFEKEIKDRKIEIQKLENKIKQKEQNLEKKYSLMEAKEAMLDKQQVQLQEDDARYKRLIGECEKTLEQSRRTLQNIAGLSAEEAKRELIKSLEDEAKKEAATRIQEIEEQTKQEIEARAKSAISLAVQRIAGEYISESSVSVVSLPNDDMKGRIIGREGRNIRAIEQATGVDLIIDDTPEAVIVSCFNPVRRQIAKITLERLIADGRIHPARIEETASRVKKEFDGIIEEQGERAAFETGITDLHPELIKRLGQLQYRTVGTQTVLQHSIEVANMCGILAAEMKLNPRIARRCGLLHDIGQVAVEGMEGSHASIGAEICSRYDEASEVTQAIREHHAEDISTLSPYGLILHTTNMISRTRPGVRKDVLESYLRRLNDMENIVRSFSGITEAYVFQAGREIRAMVSPTGVSDEEIVTLSRDIVARIKRELSFPGQIKVTVVRESKFSDFAK